MISLPPIFSSRSPQKEFSKLPFQPQASYYKDPYNIDLSQRDGRLSILIPTMQNPQLSSQKKFPLQLDLKSVRDSKPQFYIPTSYTPNLSDSQRGQEHRDSFQQRKDVLNPVYPTAPMSYRQPSLMPIQGMQPLVGMSQMGIPLQPARSQYSRPNMQSQSFTRVNNYESENKLFDLIEKQTDVIGSLNTRMATEEQKNYKKEKELLDSRLKQLENSSDIVEQKGIETKRTSMLIPIKGQPKVTIFEDSIPMTRKEKKSAVTQILNQLVASEFGGKRRKSTRKKAHMKPTLEDENEEEEEDEEVKPKSSKKKKKSKKNRHENSDSDDSS